MRTLLFERKAVTRSAPVRSRQSLHSHGQALRGGGRAGASGKVAKQGAVETPLVVESKPDFHSNFSRTSPPRSAYLGDSVDGGLSGSLELGVKLGDLLDIGLEDSHPLLVLSTGVGLSVLGLESLKALGEEHGGGLLGEGLGGGGEGGKGESKLHRRK